MSWISPQAFYRKSYAVNEYRCFSLKRHNELLDKYENLGPTILGGFLKVVVDGIIYQLQSHGGISRLFSEILPRMCDIDDSLYVMLFTSGRCRQALPAHPHIHHRPIPPVERFLRPGRLWGTIIPPAKDLIQRLWVGSAKGGIWHTTYYTMPHLSWDGPIVITVVDMIYEKFPEYFYNETKFIERKRKCIEQADKVIAISESTKRDILEYFRIPESKVTVTHLAASRFFEESPQDHKNKLREQFGLGKPFILYVGLRGGYKNFHTLLKAYSLWKRRSDFDLICVGGASQWSEDEIEVITQAKLGNSVKLFASTGDEELRAFYSCAYAFVYPSIYEGFGIPPLEAMGCGTPVIVSNTSSILEVVGDAGLYFKPSSKEELLDALDKIVDDASLHQKLVRRGLERSKMFSWHETAAETYNTYRDIL